MKMESSLVKQKTALIVSVKVSCKTMQTNILELHIGLFAEFGYASKCRVLLNDHLAEAHLLGTVQ